MSADAVRRIEKEGKLKPCERSDIEREKKLEREREREEDWP